MAPGPASNFLEVRVCSPPVMYFSFRLLISNTDRYRHISFRQYSGVYLVYEDFQIFYQHTLKLHVELLLLFVFFFLHFCFKNVFLYLFQYKISTIHLPPHCSPTIISSLKHRSFKNILSKCLKNMKKKNVFIFILLFLFKKKVLFTLLDGIY